MPPDTPAGGAPSARVGVRGAGDAPGLGAQRRGNQTRRRRVRFAVRGGGRPRRRFRVRADGTRRVRGGGRTEEDTSPTRNTVAGRRAVRLGGGLGGRRRARARKRRGVSVSARERRFITKRRDERSSSDRDKRYRRLSNDKRSRRFGRHFSDDGRLRDGPLRRRASASELCFLQTN